MKKIKQKDSIVGEIYIYSNDYIVRLNAQGRCDYYITMTTSAYHNYGGGCSGDLEEATPEQKAWLQACIEAKEFVPFEKANKHYEIY